MSKSFDLAGTALADDLLTRAVNAQRDGDFAAAADLADQAAVTPGIDALRLSRLALLYFGLECFGAAAQAYRRALQQRPGEPQLLYNLAAVLRLTGDFAEAEALCDAALLRRPGDDQALWLRSSLRRQTATHNHLTELSGARDAATDPVVRSWIGYALAKELEDLEDYGAAFAAMSDAAQARRSVLNYDVRQDEAILKEIAEVLTADMFADAPAGQACGPVFIVGLPRTGTTLVERILSRDGLLHPAGEMPDFARELVSTAQGASGAIRTPLDLVGACRKLDFQGLGRRYTTGVRARQGCGIRFIDKLPLNFLYAGLIHLALPDARIVHLVRDPVDACLSIYKHPFEAFYPFSYNLAELARYHGSYWRLMEHWRAILLPRGAMMDLTYEDLVADPEAAARRLRAFCGLPWNSACLDMASHPLPVQSASAVQVREAINARSVGKHKKYGHHLDRLRWMLGEQGHRT